MKQDRFYAMIDLSFTPLPMNPDHLRNNSLTVFWIAVSKLTPRMRRVCLLIVDDQGNILKSCWPPKVDRVSSYTLSIVQQISLDADKWEWSHLLAQKQYTARIKNLYGSRDMYHRRIALVPLVQNVLYNIC